MFTEPLHRNGRGVDSIEKGLPSTIPSLCVYGVVALQRVDQIRYNILYFSI
jgi:hypothetical protein